MVGATFHGMPHCNDERDAEPGQNREQDGRIGSEIIDPDLEEIDIPRPDFPGAAQSAGGMHGGNDMGLST